LTSERNRQEILDSSPGGVTHGQVPEGEGHAQVTRGERRMKWQPYPGYKPSGVEWLGEIPGHWHTLRLKYTSSINDEVLPENTNPDHEIQYVDISSVDAVEGIKKKEIMRFQEAPSRARRRVRNGDVIVSTVRTYLRAIAPIHNPEENLIVSTGFAVIRPQRDVNGNFAAYALRAPNFVEAVVARSVGVSYPAINAGEIGTLSIAIPPGGEQSAIAAFLDRETGRIDALMEKKQRQMELLQEKRTALISHAVTKGLDPTVPMKESGIEWLGKIPAHWELGKLKHITSSIQTGPFGSQLHAGEYVENGIPAINPSNLQNGKIVPDWRCCVDEKIFSRLKRHRLDEGDIVFARRGEMGRCALVTREEDGWLCGTGSIRIRINKENAYPPFVYQVLSTPGVRDWLFLESVGSTMDNLNTEIMSQIPILLPPLDEQIYVVGKIEKHLQQIDNLKTKIQESLDRLKEYRTALISAAVTGRIDVREEVA
jgi:type I restriction enzyme, S subunit